MGMQEAQIFASLFFAGGQICDFLTQRSRLRAFRLVAAAALSAMAGPAIAAGYCKTLSGAMVGFGEQTTRGDAEKALDTVIAGWEQRSGLKAKPKDRKLAAKCISNG